MARFVFFQGLVKLFLDNGKGFIYIHVMFTQAMVIVRAILKAAWNTSAVAEGGFY